MNNTSAKPNHLQLLCDFSELNWVFSASRSIDNFFDKLVDMVAEHMRTAVCSIYLYDQEQQELRLKATHGLKGDTARLIHMKLGEGLTGRAMLEEKTIVTEKASTQTGYKFFGGTNEEDFEVFMAVPILRGLIKIGVMVLQREEGKPFSHAETTVTQAIASQLANIIENAGLLAQADEGESASRPEIFSDLKFIRGRSANEGLVKGAAFIWRRHQDLHEYLAAMPVQALSIDDFQASITTTEKQLKIIQAEVEEQLSDVASLIFSAHLLMLKDRGFITKIEHSIDLGMAPGQAIVETASYYIDRFAKIEDHYIREKADDVRDLATRMLRNLPGGKDDLSNLKGRVIIADQLLPSDILKLSHEKIVGIILVSGGITSHVALLARSLEIPLVIADEPRLLYVSSDSLVLLDAGSGNIYINPEPSVLGIFTEKQRELQESAKLDQELEATTRTRDGQTLSINSNINLLSDLKTANRYHAEGIGLYRSEMPFLVRSDFPSEEEQFVVYRRLAAGMPDKPLTFRTLDIGGDKVLSYYHHEKEENPFMGMRSIRFSLLHKDIFVRQIRAVLRACHESDLRIMFPMISSVEEFIESRQVLHDCLLELASENVAFNRHPKIGMMVEIPSVIDIIDDLAREADFFSIGTNDLIQYLLAVDRTNEKVASLYIPHHPAVLRALKRIVGQANRHNVPVSVCGDMANREIYLPFLIGIGVRNLSVDPIYLPKIKKACILIDLKEAEKIAHTLLGISSIKDIERVLKLQPELI